MESERKVRVKRMRRKRKELRRGVRTLPFLFLSLFLSGCSLAKADLQEAAKAQERICGVLVTVGDQRAQFREDADLEGRTFSSVRELEEAIAATASVKVEGTPAEDGSYVFAGIPGHFFGVFEKEDEEGPYTHFVNDGSFADVEAHTRVTDTGTEREMKAVVMAPPGLQEPVYMNPVYQRGDGTVYVSLSGGGFLTGGVYEEDGSRIGGTREEGEVYAKTFTSKEARNVNGKEEADLLELTVSCKVGYPAEAVRILEMSAENELLGTQAVSRETEQAALHEKTAYVIVEEERADGTLGRSLYDCGRKAEEGILNHTVYYPGEDGLLIPAELYLVPAKAGEDPHSD